MPLFRDSLVTLLEKAEQIIPQAWLPELPPGDNTSGMPEWRDFETQLWEVGEEIRLILLTEKGLRQDEELQNAFCRIACNRNAKNGRQPFFGLLGYTSCKRLAPLIAEQLDDHRVSGHVISALLKMKADGFAPEIAPLKNSGKAWIRKKSKMYCERYPRRKL
ncbi:MAG: hypothetical protein ACI8UO_001279 [Verrucomicrobiales bacterium]|jgi:hypothetical protein